MVKQLNLTRFRLAGLLVILGATLLILLPPYLSFFYLDDYKFIEFIRATAAKPWTAYKIASPFWIGWNYRPTQLWFTLVNFLLFGINPAGYYLALVALHLLNIVLLYALARLWRVGVFGSLLAAALFAINFAHQDTVAWISSSSIVLGATAALLAVYAYSRFLYTRRRHKALLLLTVVSVVLALLSREENVVVPIILIAVWALFPDRRRPARAEIIAFILIMISLFLYGYFQIIRPTWGGILEGNHLENITNSLADLGPLAVIGRSGIVLLLPSLAAVEIDNPITILSGLLLSAILIFWFIHGNRASRLGIAWAVLYLGILFVLSSALLLWLAPRYFYLPWIGLSLALGATLERLSRRWPRYESAVRIALFGGLILFLFYHSGQIRRGHATIDEFVLEIDTVREQMVTLVPRPGEDTNFFAYEFPPVTDYIQVMAAVWYDLDLHGAGGWHNRLLWLGKANPDDYLLTYEDGRLFNLMPELQAAEQTIFIWDETPLLETVRLDGSATLLNDSNYQLYRVYGPTGARRFASFLHPPAPDEGWASLGYSVSVPENGDLRFGIRRESSGLVEEDGMFFRVRAIDAGGNSQILFEQFVDSNDHDLNNPWTDVSIPMSDYWGMTVELRFETAANGNIIHDHGYWSNPRFTIDPR